MKIASVENSMIVFGDDDKKYKIIENGKHFILSHMSNDQWWPTKIKKEHLSDMIKYLENRFLYQGKVKSWNSKYKFGDEIELSNNLVGIITSEAILDFDNNIVFWAKINSGSDIAFKKYVINGNVFVEYKK